MSVLYRANVSRVDVEGTFVEIAELGAGFEYGPCTLLPIEVEVGDRVLVGNIGDVQEDFVIVGPLVDAHDEPDNTSQIYFFETVAARNAALPTPASGTFAWIDDDQIITVYSDEPTAGWRSIGRTFSIPVDFNGAVKFNDVISSRVTIERPLSTDAAVASYASGDANWRFFINADGRHGFGDGVGDRDTFFYRSAAAVLRFEDSIAVANQVTANGQFEVDKTSGAATDPGYRSKMTGDTQYRLITRVDGRLLWGSGTATQDTNLYRSAAGVLKTDGDIEVGSDVLMPADLSQVKIGGSPSGASLAIMRTTTGLILTGRNSGDTINNRFELYSDGLVQWGNGTVVDTNLYRSAANVLSTDDSFTVGGNLSVTGTAFDQSKLTNLMSGDSVSNAAVTATTDSTSSTSFVNMAGTGSVTSISFTKKYASSISKLCVTVVAGLYVSNADTRGTIAVQIAGNDFPVFQTATQAVNEHEQYTSTIYVGGVAAGATTIQARWRRHVGTGSLNRGVDDWLTIDVKEVPV